MSKAEEEEEYAALPEPQRVGDGCETDVWLLRKITSEAWTEFSRSDRIPPLSEATASAVDKSANSASSSGAELE